MTMLSTLIFLTSCLLVHSAPVATITFLPKKECNGIANSRFRAPATLKLVYANSKKVVTAIKFFNLPATEKSIYEQYEAGGVPVVTIPQSGETYGKVNPADKFIVTLLVTFDFNAAGRQGAFQPENYYELPAGAAQKTSVKPDNLRIDANDVAEGNQNMGIDKIEIKDGTNVVFTHDFGLAKDCTNPGKLIWNHGIYYLNKAHSRWDTMYFTHKNVPEHLNLDFY